MRQPEKTASRDLLGDRRAAALGWGLPVTAMVAATFVSHPPKTWIWAAALIWMGAACIANARRCGRTHCHYTGPFFLMMAVPVVLHGHEILWLGTEGWKWLGASIGAGGLGLWWLTERLSGKYRR